MPHFLVRLPQDAHFRNEATRNRTVDERKRPVRRHRGGERETPRAEEREEDRNPPESPGSSCPPPPLSVIAGPEPATPAAEPGRAGLRESSPPPKAPAPFASVPPARAAAGASSFAAPAAVRGFVKPRADG